MSILIQPDFMTLFDADRSCYQDFEKRRSLRGELTKWLYNFYTSQQHVQSHDINFIRELCGSECELKQFRHKLGQSLQQLVDKAAIKAYEVNGYRVSVTPAANSAAKLGRVSATPASSTGVSTIEDTSTVEEHDSKSLEGAAQCDREYVFREPRRTSGKASRRSEVAL